MGSVEIQGWRLENEGPEVAIVGMNHGSEYIGGLVSRRLEEVAGEKEFNVSLNVVEMANPVSALVKDAVIPEGVDDTWMKRNLNRYYPGDSEGSFSEKLAAVVWKQVSDADYLIDLHSGTVKGEIHPQVRIRTDEEVDEDIRREAARIAGGTGFDLVRIPSSQVARNRQGEPLTSCAMKNSIPAVTLEYGGGYVAGEDVEAVVKAVEDMVAAVESSEEALEEARTFSELSKVNSPAAGFVYYNFELGEEFEEGDTVVEVRDREGRVSGIQAERDGCLGFRVDSRYVNEGDYLGELLYL